MENIGRKIVLGLIGLWVLVAATRKPAGAAASVGVAIYDEQGYPAAVMSGSWVLTPGTPYTIAVTANNLTKQAGVNVSATLTTKLTVTMGGVTVLDPAAWVFSFPPGGTDYRTAQFTPTTAMVGQTGAAAATVKDPNGVQIAADSASLSVVSPTVYGATVSVVVV